MTFRERLAAIARLHQLSPTEHQQIEDAFANLTPDEWAAVEGGTADPATAAPGGALAALLAMLTGIFSNPQVVQLILTLLGSIIPKPAPAPAPTPAPAK